MIQATVVADSLNPQGDRLTSLLCTFPKYLLAEAKTHRIVSQDSNEVVIEQLDVSFNAAKELSRNSASSRAIPTNRLLKMVEENPFIPIAWQKEHKGMQGTEYFTNENEIRYLNDTWLQGRNDALQKVRLLLNAGATKQLANRLLEPFLWTTVLVSATEWENFFELRCPNYKPNFDRAGSYKSIKEMASKTVGTHMYYTVNDRKYTDGMWCTFVEALHSGLNKGQAEIHMMALAEAIYNAWKESTPKQLKAGEWHIPYYDKIDVDKIRMFRYGTHAPTTDVVEDMIKVSTAMAARTSYTTVGDEKEVSYETLLNIHDKMAVAKPFHASPFEHCSRAMSEAEQEQNIKGIVRWIDIGKDIGIVNKNDIGWCKNFKGFIQYRHLLETNSPLF